MIIKRKALSRRSLLRGMGVTVGLPFLDAMQPALAAPAKERPVRMVFLYVPNGIDMANWNPSYKGPLQKLPRILEPLEPFKNDLLLMGNLTHNYARPLLDGAGDHGRCSANYLTGAHVRKTATDIYVNGPMSVDQLVATVWDQARVCRRSRLVWRTRGNPGAAIPAIPAHTRTTSPGRARHSRCHRFLMRECFLSGSSGLTLASALRSVGNANSLRTSVLDFVQESTGRLKKNLGPTDRRKLDEYLTGIRSIRDAATASGEGRNACRPRHRQARRSARRFRRAFQTADGHAYGGVPRRSNPCGNVHDHARGHFAPLPRDRHLRRPSPVDTPHGQTRSAGQGHSHKRVSRAHLAAWLEKLNGIEEEGGRLMDNLMMVYGASLSDGNRHLHEDLPTLLIGRGGGTIKTGRRVVFRRETPFCNLHLSLMDRMGAEVESFGDSSGRLPDLGTA